MKNHSSFSSAVLRLLVLVVAVWCVATTASAATFTVCASGCGFTSIQSAANAATSGDVIELEPETFTEGNILISKDLTLRASTGMATINGGGADWTLKVGINKVVNLEHLVLDGGAIKGMLLNHGTTELSSVHVMGDSGGTTYGGIFNGVSGTLTLTDASLVAANTSPTRGGGINNFGGDLVINNSTIMGNEGRRGGGVYNSNGGDVSVTNSSFSFNHATHNGGAWYNDFSSTFDFQSSSSYSGNTAGECERFENIVTAECVD